jgi:type VI secretion system protein ImpH
MADQSRTPGHALSPLPQLQEKPYEWGFFQALRRIECANPERPRIGESLRPLDDPVRLAQEPSLLFAPATLAACRPGANGRPPRLSVNFFGMFGPNGPLPLHLTEYARERLQYAKDTTLVRFLDVFHHRMLSLFYRAWADPQPTVNFDRPDADRFAVYLGAMFGLGMPSLRQRDAAPDLAKLHFAGHLAGHTHHAEGLRSILLAFFRLPIEIDQFVGHWLEVPRRSRCRLGESPQTGALGSTAFLGARVWDCQSKFRITIGPMGLADYQRLLPGGDSLRRLIAWVRDYVGDELEWDANLVLKQAEVPPLQLGKIGQLGWTTWITSRPLTRDADDLCLNPAAYTKC